MAGNRERSMSLPEPKAPEFTLEDWKSWEGRWELIDGVAYDMTPAPSLEHQTISVNITLGIGNALSETKRRTGGGKKASHSWADGSRSR